MPAEVEARITADASGVEPGAKEAGTLIAGVQEFVERLQAAFASMGAASQAAFAEVSAGAKEAGATIEGVGESVRTFNSALSGIGATFIAAFAIGGLVNFARQMGEAGEQTVHMAEILGTTVPQTQQLNAAFTLMGVSVQRGDLAMERLMRSFAVAREGSKQQKLAFDELGVSVSKNYTSMQLLGAVMDGFKSQADGPQKAAEAMMLFGRSGAAMIPFLNQGKEGMDELNRVTAQYGIGGGFAQQAAEKAAQLGSAFNENKVAGQGLQNVLADALAPAMTIIVQQANQMIAGFIQSYKEGGLAKQAMDALAIAIKVLVGVIDALIFAFVNTAEVTKATVDAMLGSWSQFVTVFQDGVQLVEDAVAAMAKVIYDAITGAIINAANDAQAGWKKIQDDAAKTANAVQAAFHAASAASAGDWAEQAKSAKAFEDQIKSLINGPMHQLKTTGEGTGDTSGDPTGGKHHKGGGESQVGQWAEQLHEQELAAAAASGDYMKDQTQLELDFWNQKLALTKTGSKAWYEVQDKIFALMKQRQSEAYASLVAGDKEKIAADKGNVDALAADWAHYLADVASAYGQDSAAFKNALAEKVRAERQADAEIKRARLEAITKASQDAARAAREELSTIIATKGEEIDAVKAAYEQGSISRRREWAEIEALQAQETEAKRQAAQEEYLATAERLNAEISAETAFSDKWKELLQERVDAYRAFQDELTKISADAAKTRLKDEQEENTQFDKQWKGAVDGMVTSFSSGFLAVARGQRTWAQEMVSIEGKLVDDLVSKVIDPWIEKWLMAQLRVLFGQRTTDAAKVASQSSASAAGAAIATSQSAIQVGQNAGIAFSGVLASLARIPFIGPFIAPAIAAGIFALAMSHKAEGGFDVPAGLSPVTQLHPQEMVLPAPLAQGFRSIIGAQGSGAGAPSSGAAAGGDVFHFHIEATDRDSFANMLEDEQSHLFELIHGAIRGGARLPAT